MKILFDLGAKAFLRNFASTVSGLEARGHEVEQISSSNKAYPCSRFAVEDMENNMRLTRQVFYRSDSLASQSLLMRLARDYAWYSQPRLRRSEKCRERCRNMLEKGLPVEWQEDAAALSKTLAGLDHEARLAFSQALAVMEKHLPPDAQYVEFLRVRDPDLLVVTPLVFTQYGQYDMIKAAKHLGIPVIYAVYSWDNLTTKGVLHIAPDHVLVWNEVQKRELAELHDFPAENVTIVGAARFDDFFAMKPTPRDEFCAAYGLDPAKLLIAYLGSWSFVAPDEAAFIRRLSDALKTSTNPQLAAASLVLKPHPKTIEQWNGSAVEQSGLAAICSSPQSNADQLLFDVIYHSFAAVGINTSAEIEAAIIGRPVFTVELPEFKESQDGSVHFSYLLRENGGPVEVAQSLEDLCAKLALAVAAGGASAGTPNFLETFLRPRGIGTPVAPIYVDEIERLVIALAPLKSRKTARNGAEHLAGTYAAKKNQTTQAKFEAKALRLEKARKDKAAEIIKNSPNPPQEAGRTTTCSGWWEKIRKNLTAGS